MKISPGDAGSCSTRLATIKHNRTVALKEPLSTLTCWTAYGVHYNMLHISQSLCLNQWSICSHRSTSQLSSLCSHSQQTCHNAPSPGPVLPCFGEITVYQYGNKYSHFKNTQRLWCGAHKDSQTSICPWPAKNTSLICQTIFQEIEGSCKMLFSDETLISIPKDRAHDHGALCRVNQLCICFCRYSVAMTTLLHNAITFKGKNESWSVLGMQLDNVGYDRMYIGLHSLDIFMKILFH